MFSNRLSILQKPYTLYGIVAQQLFIETMYLSIHLFLALNILQILCQLYFCYLHNNIITCIMFTK